MKTLLLIINADDFGKDPLTNQAVIQCFKQGFCSSATLMPNMPGFEEACAMARDHRLLNHIGLHLTLRDGDPLTEGIRHFPRFCDKEGHLCLARREGLPILGLETQERDALAQEIRAQMKRCRDHGIPLTHVDSHYHLHNEWAILSVLIPILYERKILFLRIARNCGEGLTLVKRGYKVLLNRKIWQARLDRTRYFGSLQDYASFKRHRAPTEIIESFEVMIHPTYASDGKRLVDDLTDQPLEEALQVVEGYREAVSYLWYRWRPPS